MLLRVDSFFLATKDGEGAALKFFCLKFASKSPITLDLQVMTAMIPPGPGDCNDVSDDGSEKWMLRFKFAGRGEF